LFKGLNLLVIIPVNSQNLFLFFCVEINDYSLLERWRQWNITNVLFTAYDLFCYALRIDQIRSTSFCFFCVEEVTCSSLDTERQAKENDFIAA